MYFIYLIEHNITKEIYVGKTSNLTRRLKEHNAGFVKSTYRKNGKWILIYVEAYRDKKDADKRECKLKKHGSNKRWLINRIKFSLFN